MKNFFLLLTFMISTLSINAQELNIGISGALPVGDASDISSFGVNAEATYLRAFGEQLDLGLNAGYLHYFGKDYDSSFGTFETEDLGFLPIALAGRFNATSNLVLGADLGYAIGISPSDIDGGFYYAPKVLYGITHSLDVVLSYRSVNLDGISIDAFTFGVEYGL